jgi:rod shape-determining protein MreC
LLLLFLLLELFCFYLIGNNNQYHRAAYLNTANAVNGSLFETYNRTTGYLTLGRVNDSLVQENAELRAMLKQSQYENLFQLKTATDTIDNATIQHYTYIPARVVRNTVDKANNIIYINRGSVHGITNQMGVISMNGIVGQVVNVTPHYSAIMSVLHKDFKVTARLKKNNYYGNLRWSGLSSTSARIDEIPKHVSVKVGDTVNTNGYSSIFPENIMIGFVKSVHAEPDKPFVEIDVKLSTNFNNLSYVYVVKNLQRNEILKLDSAAAAQNKQ